MLGLTAARVTAVVTSAATQPFQKSPPPLAPVHILISYYAKTLFNIILPSMPRHKDVSYIKLTQLKFVHNSQFSVRATSPT